MTLKHIAYIELDTHAEIASRFMALAEGLDFCRVDYYFSEKIMGRLDAGGLSSGQICVAEASALLEAMTGKSYDLVVIGTVHRYFRVFRRVADRYKTAVVVHNVNFSGLSRWQLLRAVMEGDWVYRLKLLFREGLMAAPSVYRLADYRLVLDNGLSGALATIWDGKSKVLPLFFNAYGEGSREAELTVVVPGAVSQKRRDYAHILKTLETFTTPIRVVFLGKCEGAELERVKAFERTKPLGVSLVYFTEKVPQDRFNEWMKRAHVLWCPLRIETSFFGCREVYGTTKMTGNLGDAIGFAKPVVFPKGYAGLLPFTEEESDRLEAQLRALAHRTEADFETYSKANVSRAFERSLNEMLEG
ncbi:hypothetical protein [Bergeyella sp. RCAD1439]|uniref:hypothetical protein n=1 Tax=Bergeyella anatis TaxID=3113737 RepID=UPI002E18DA14|nr:hypothetical protein [Bergeyella sp. RCAD1439]